MELTEDDTRYIRERFSDYRLSAEDIKNFHQISGKKDGKVLQHLTPRERSVFACVCLNMTWNEIVEAFDMPVETLRARYYRAKDKV